MEIVGPQELYPAKPKALSVAKGIPKDHRSLNINILYLDMFSPPRHNFYQGSGINYYRSPQSIFTGGNPNDCPIRGIGFVSSS